MTPSLICYSCCRQPRRGYDSPRWREQAAETRRKILDAAEDLSARDGYAAIAMPAIADRAGVALKTVYLAPHASPG